MSSTDVDAKARAESRVGRVLREKWHLDRLLGVGGMAAVYEATHRNGQRAAVKVLHPEAALASDIKARFLREGYIANKVQHPGAVSVLDDDVDSDGSVFLVMELLHGDTLESHWSRGEFIAWEDAAVIADRILDVLTAAHERNIVHRDLKPANIFLDRSGQIKILDFGIARLQSPTQPGATGRDMALGTPGFMPPEQARGHWQDVDAQSDLWAVGATMFCVLTGRYVHEAPTVNEQLLAAMTEPAAPVAQFARNVPAEIAEIVDRALRYEKADRWPDAASMRTALRDGYAKIKGSPLPTSVALAQVRPIGSVRPDAPTLAAPDPTTARPVSRSGSVSAVDAPSKVTLRSQPATSRSKRWAVLGAAATAALGVVWLLSHRASPMAPAAVSAVSTLPSATAPSLALPMPNVSAASSVPSLAPEADTSAAVPAASSAPGTTAPKLTRTPRKSAPKPQAPAASVDIFTRRR